MSAATGTILPMGKRELELGGKYLGNLRDSNELLDNPEALRARMTEDGYLLLRGLQPRENVVAARRVLLENLSANKQLDPNAPLMDGVIGEGGRGAFMGGAKAVTHTPEFLSVVESPQIMGFFDRFFSEQSLTFDYKWLRAVGKGGYTGAHYDVVYMGRGSARLHTVWTPLADISYEDGPLALLLGSHNLEGFKKLRETYGRMDVDRDKVQGWFSDDPMHLVDTFGGRFATTEFRMGDVLIFGMYTMHGSITNQTGRFRLSCDTRYQPASDPVDERWVGENPIAHYGWHKGETKSMETARKEWGV
ncbi:MAG: phytanoyl-CoA dioxygenase family protein [Planctomycetota bacterium]|nr:phytanoyl-CoA dioxygenase family protein [Planctomycetota bacterium]